LGALSWIILHEIAHIHHGDQKIIPAALLVKQEYKADDFATRWILDIAGNGLQREFRVLMIIVALTWLFLHERAVGTGTDHPPVILRFREAVRLFQMSERSVGLQNAAYVLKALLDPAMSAPPHETAKDYFEWICSRLEVLYGTNEQSVGSTEAS
jgi:Peptidase U49